MFRNLLGLFIITLGILLFLTNFLDYNFNAIFKILWPSFIILLGVTGIYVNKKVGVMNVIVLLVGFNFLLLNLDLLDESLLKIIFWPFILILIGISLMGKSNPQKRIANNRKEYVAIFGGIEEKNDDNSFEHSAITTIFGGAELDFSNIKLKKDSASIDVTLAFGGVELRVPDNVDVIVNGLPIFGGVDNKTENKGAKKQLFINYTVLFGGLEIKN